MQAKNLHSTPEDQAGAFYGVHCGQQVAVYNFAYLHQTQLTHETCQPFKFEVNFRTIKHTIYVYILLI